MNYRHAFHAGNFADVFKHIVLTRLLIYAMRKPAALRYIDSHAGIGLYDLRGDEAQRTGEWLYGIQRVVDHAFSPNVSALIAPYLERARHDVQQMAYAGSPLLAQSLLRGQDRLSFCEWHEQDVAALRMAVGRDRRAKVLHIDGYMALNAYVPPLERRGVVLIDPPFEARDEFELMCAGLAKAYGKWPRGCYALWYPIKERVAVQRFYAAIKAMGIASALAIECAVDDLGAGPLTANGMVVINPPYVLYDELAMIMPELVASLARGTGAHHQLIWLAQS